MKVILASVFLKYLLRLVPGIPLPALLIPLHQLRRDGDTWQSLGHDPHFLMTANASQPGWYKTSIQMDLSTDQSDVKLYADMGNGFSEEHAITLNVASGKLESRYWYLQRKPQRLRFDPMTSDGTFRVLTLSFDRCGEPPVKEVTEHISTVHHGFKSLTHDQIQEHADHRAKTDKIPSKTALWQIYDATFTQTASSVSYHHWIRTAEATASNELDMRRAKSADRLLFSIIVPVYNPVPAELSQLIASVQAQTYKNWELCLANDASTDPEVTAVLDQATSDNRISVRHRATNGHISKASNDGLAMASGDYCVLLDHDDLLHPNALAHVAEAIERHPTAKLLYSDEDKISEAAGRYDPYFKPDFNLDLLYSQNYISHLGVYERQLLDDIGGFRTGVEGSQDHDLALRCVAKIAHDQVIHIPHVLYHWRATTGSTALAASEKSYTADASIKALTDYFSSRDETVSVTPGMLPNTYRCRWSIQEPLPLVSLIIPTRDQAPILAACVHSILQKTSYSHFEILIVDNQSEEEETFALFESLAADTRVQVLQYDQPFNYSAINNFAAEQANGEVIGLVNNDIEVISEDWLEEMVSHAMRPDVGCVGAKLYYPNDLIQHAGVITGIGGIAGHAHKYFKRSDHGYFSRLKVIQNYSAVTAATMLVRKDTFLANDGLRESLAVAFNDVDFCLRVQDSGLRNVWTPYAELYHHESISRGSDITGEKLERFQRERDKMISYWGDRLNHDPCYNPNLSKITEDFTIGVPDQYEASETMNAERDSG